MSTRRKDLFSVSSLLSISGDDLCLSVVVGWFVFHPIGVTLLLAQLGSEVMSEEPGLRRRESKTSSASAREERQWQ